MREPLTDRVRRLAQETKRHDLLCLRSCDLHPHSWFSVAWYPLYRIPAGGCLKELSACFLTFHPMTLPLQWSRIAALPKAGKAGSLPPFPLRAGLADPALQPPAASPAVAAALAPALDERRAAAARILSQGLPARHMLTFLMPFAFVPYKAQVRWGPCPALMQAWPHSFLPDAPGHGQHILRILPLVAVCSYQRPTSGSGSSELMQI